MNILFKQSRGAIRAMREIARYAGFKIVVYSLPLVYAAAIPVSRMGIVFWAAQYTQIMDVTHPLAGLINLYKPLFYLILFLMGYYVFSHNQVHEALAQYCTQLCLLWLSTSP